MLYYKARMLVIDIVHSKIGEVLILNLLDIPQVKIYHACEQSRLYLTSVKLRDRGNEHHFLS